MIINLSEYLGEVKNDTMKWGNAFIFNVIASDSEQKPHSFNCILFVHEDVPAFVSLSEADSKYDKNTILEKIFEKYTLAELLKVRHEN